MTKFLLLAGMSFTSLLAFSQLYDDFSDGDYTKNPAWVASQNDFTVNAGGQLQSANTNANATFFITTSNSLALDTQWEFWVKLDFNTSSANYVDIWLMAADADLAGSGNTGYFVRFGSADDNISLFKKSTTAPAQKMISGKAGILNSSSSICKIKVIRTPGDKWILLRDMTGTGTSYRSEGEIADGEITTSSHFGVLIRQSTASFFQRHYFDDFIVKQNDVLPAKLSIVDIRAIAANKMQIKFDNPLNVASAEDISHFFVNNIGSPATADVDAIDGSTVYLTFAAAFKANQKNTIILDEVADVFGNKIHQQMADFYFYEAGRFDVVINEVFANPSPQVGLPSQKFIELKNTAGFPVNLFGWRLSDGNNSAILPSVEIMPDSFLIVTTTSGLDSYRLFGKTVAVANFPSLNISGSRLILFDNSGMTVHAMSYDLTTYKNEIKKGGGFSLEMINSRYGCSGFENWIASKDEAGGTPGRKNSVEGNEIPATDIKPLHAFLAAPDTLLVFLNKSVDSATSALPDNYILSDGILAHQIEVLPPFFNGIKITLSTPASRGTIHTVGIKNLKDCAGNSMSVTKHVRFAIPESPMPGDVVINEILSEPKTTGAEYVEIYNNSEKTLDMSKLYISNRNSAGEPASAVRLRSTSALFFPGAFAVLTKDSAATVSDFPYADAAAIIKMSALPSFPNDKGFVLISDHQGNILDEVSYNKSWHFALIKEKKGVSLERISYHEPSNASNFHSASKDVGFGTPGIKNSQRRDDEDAGGVIQIFPKVFSPDNDGTDDFLTIYYAFESAGYVTNIKVYDAAGRMVRYLEKNSLSGQKGYYRWDGLDEKNQQLPQGIYLIHFESFNERGRKIVHKKAVVLARR